MATNLPLLKVNLNLLHLAILVTFYKVSNQIYCRQHNKLHVTLDVPLQAIARNIFVAWKLNFNNEPLYSKKLQYIYDQGTDLLQLCSMAKSGLEFIILFWAFI
jgi:hypothetical protein